MLFLYILVGSKGLTQLYFTGLFVSHWIFLWSILLLIRCTNSFCWLCTRFAAWNIQEQCAWYWEFSLSYPWLLQTWLWYLWFSSIRVIMCLLSFFITNFFSDKCKTAVLLPCTMNGSVLIDILIWNFPDSGSGIWFQSSVWCWLSGIYLFCCSYFCFVSPFCWSLGNFLTFKFFVIDLTVENE